MKNTKSVFLFSMAAIILITSYPLFMAFKTIYLLILNGTIMASEYERYIIPYAPIAISLILTFSFYPLIRKALNRKALLTSTGIGFVVFFICEIFFEKIEVVFKGSIKMLDDFQSLLCYRPTILNDLLFSQKSIAYKMHFYLISLAIISILLCLLECAYRLFADKDKSQKRPFISILSCAIIFIGLCIFTNITSFFRTGNRELSLLSGFLTSAFFISFSLCAGLYFGFLLFGKRKLCSVFIPSMISFLMCILMYIGEMRLLGGELYRFGQTFMFLPMGSLILAPVDIIVILLSGIISLAVLLLLKKKN